MYNLVKKKNEKLVGYYQQLHFKCNELELFYNMPVVAPDDASLEECPYIDKLICSKAYEYAPDKCETERKCEILELRNKLFSEKGINAIELRELDKLLRT